MPKFTVYRAQSPAHMRKYMKSPLKPVDAIKTPGFSLGLPQTTIVYPQNEVGRYRIRTVLAARIERKVFRTTSNTPDIESLWPRHSIPSKDLGSNSKLLKFGIKVKKIAHIPPHQNSKSISLSAVTKLTAEDFRNKLNQTYKILVNKDPNDSSQDQDESKRNNLSMDEKYNMCEITELPSLWPGQRSNGSPEIRRAFTSLSGKKKVIKKVEKISVKEAMRDKEWIIKAKNKIMKDLYYHINWSNGICVNIPKDNIGNYKYYLGSGNNSKLIKQVMSNRWWWTRVPEEEKESAHFIWTQWKEWEFIKSLPCIEDISHQIETTNQFSLDCKIKYTQVNVNNVLSLPKSVDISPFGYDFITKSSSFTHIGIKTTIIGSEIKISNKIEHNYNLSNKKALFYNLVRYYECIGENPFEYIPLTYHIKLGESDPAFKKFEEKFYEYDKLVDEYGKKLVNLWIVKPGENTNRGNGISVISDLSSIKGEIRGNPCPSTGQHTFIIQKYIEKPFLVSKRKFDIRCYAMITCINGIIQGYFYQEGYIRTSSKNFSLTSTNKFVHLTNDAVQKKCEDYGKFEKANKMSYADFQRYLDNHHPSKVDFLTQILPQIRKVVKDTIQAVFMKIDTNKRAHSLEVFGYDFLLDNCLKPWLLEVNTNPCLELSSPHLCRIIPAMIENSLRIGLDPLFPEPGNSKKVSTEMLFENKYELIFHSLIDGVSFINMMKSKERLEEFMAVDEDLLEMVDEESEEHPDSDENADLI
ncbi:hypothetical protein SteCoe_26218 [Stentor coeruleus]|uniref:Tubulin--tyrosine ligase-like protein 9 n=1 Tax=Stentor coeruleus TaxID=5963 RepID=A0A1R2BDK1_9CILI|nr:hypothetical protein SteCoe_26218 [Stentor coeruleus]